MRLLFPFALYLTAAAYQQNPDPWAQANRYRDSACAEVRGLKDGDCGNLPKGKIMPHYVAPTKKEWEDLKAENARLKAELAGAKESSEVGYLKATIERLQTELNSAKEATAQCKHME